MSHLLRKPRGDHGKIHDISPEDADWGYVGFGVYRLAAGESASEATGGREAILVLVEGKAELTASGTAFGEMGDRMSVFERKPPHCLYVPNDSDWSAVASRRSWSAPRGAAGPSSCGLGSSACVRTSCIMSSARS